MTTFILGVTTLLFLCDDIHKCYDNLCILCDDFHNQCDVFIDGCHIKFDGCHTRYDTIMRSIMSYLL